MKQANKPIGTGVVIAVLVVVFALAGYALLRSGNQRDSAANEATDTGRTQMGAMFSQMQQQGGPPGSSSPGGPGMPGPASMGGGGMPMTSAGSAPYGMPAATGNR